MASDTQLALRGYRPGAPNLTKAARQSVPQFLQKLYEIVNDPNNNDMIRWTDNGDSFVVLDHERLSREVLGRWFKHQKFASFVRQLNMYGFHKIPHLQQGVLKSDSDTEIWNFEHPHFHRGQPDLLCFIQRKKQAAQGGAAEDAIVEAKDTNAQASSSSAQPTNAQLLDMNSIVSGIAAVKRHQQAISAELNELKTSNQHLWQEALAARERHKAHQDTINRILKFLASVFGRSNGHDSKDHDDHDSPQPIVSRKRQRLMIGGVEAKPKGVEVVEVDDDDEKDPPRLDRRSRSPSRFARIDTPSSAASPSVRTDAFSPMLPAASFFPNTSTSRITQQSWDDMQRQALASGSGYAQRPTPIETPGSQTPFPPSATPSNQQLTTVPPQNPTETTLQSAFQQLIHSPAQLQRFMQALSNASNLQSQSLPVPPYTAAPHHSQITPYEPPMDFNYFVPDPSASANMHALLPKADDGPLLEPLINNTAHLQKSYKDSSEIEADVDAIQASINSLMDHLGLDPSLMTAADEQQHSGNLQPQPQPQPQPPHAEGSPGAPSAMDAPDFDFDAFLQQFAQQAPDAPGADLDLDLQLDGAAELDEIAPAGRADDPPLQQLHAFLDEVVSASDGASPVLRTVDGKAAKAGAAGAGRKRPSDVAELAQELPLLAAEPAPKRSKT